jgi:hypothetical protein
MKKDSQAWYNYGNRTNNFLLVNYGFCFQNNWHDSFKFNLRMDADLEKGPLTPENITAPLSKEDAV